MTLRPAKVHLVNRRRDDDVVQAPVDPFSTYSGGGMTTFVRFGSDQEAKFSAKVREQHMKVPLRSLAGLAALAFVASAVAAQLPKQGHYAFTACFSGVANMIAFSKGFRGYSYELTGTNRSDKPGTIMDHTSFRCVGVNTSLGGKPTVDTLCEIKDSDGDKQLAKIGMDAEGRQTREFIAGTGKYEGMQMTGTVVLFKRFPVIKPGTFQVCNHQTGTYTLK